MKFGTNLKSQKHKIRTSGARPPSGNKSPGAFHSPSSLINLQWRLDTDDPNVLAALLLLRAKCCCLANRWHISFTWSLEAVGFVWFFRSPPCPPPPVMLLRADVMRRGWVIRQSVVFRCDRTADAHHHSDVALRGREELEHVSADAPEPHQSFIKKDWRLPPTAAAHSIEALSCHRATSLNPFHTFLLPTPLLYLAIN